ncbi:MAG: tRNA (N6-isopentenyl adenosine(37)-C2)-methylthiotransferase MiaB [Deltaproteobacteria bacterium]|nr:tRNA (N6-isopentenyl adenosine(37)-C2)-methylthiotransferase MiaB [Deltaproteobacteria bacterium]
MKRLYIQTYGCQMNQHDSDRILRVLGRTDYAATDKAEEADVILLNTCSVRDRAEQKVYSALGRWRELKEKKKDLVIGVGGCVAQQEGEDLLRRLPYLDLVFGTHNIHRLGQMVEEVRSLGNRPVEIGFYRDPSYMEEPQGKPEVKGAKALVTIMQGCNKVCSFCIVPHVRGQEISRPGEKIVGEIRDLVRHGVKEVMLLGQNVNSYGKMSAGEMTFPQLLRRIDSIEGLERIRFTTSHPQDLSLDLIEAYASLEKLCGHLHLPVQSGSDNVLQRMRRGYSRREYMEKIRRLRKRCPEVALSTDIIAGFPGETEEDFEQTLEILREVEYIEIFAFTFSPRPQTVAAKIYPDDVPGEIKKRRLESAQNLQHDISLRKNREKIGSVEENLVEGRSKLRQGQIMGRTRTNRIVNAWGPDSLAGKMVDVRIIGASANSLLGELVAVHQRGIA